jgi:hypothetical protein
VIGFFWPPMHMRGHATSLTDTLHIAFTFITVPLMLLEIIFGASVFGRAFRFYSALTVVAVMVFGVFTGLDGPNIAADLPTPLIGVWERISIGAFMLWTGIFSVALFNSIDERAWNARGGTYLRTISSKHGA